MNIEELELSLRTEFESQVRSVLAGIKTEVSEFQNRFQTEFEQHRAKLDRTISELSSRLPETVVFDAAFTESVNEHLRLARDDGASVAAVAFGEAEKLRAETESKAVGGFDLMRDAIAEISSNNTQATILQALVDQASRFAARGAFFILKNDHFVGWRIFGAHAPADGGGVREVLFSASANTVLASSANSMAKTSAQAGEYVEDQLFLDALNFGRPAELHAIPLTARGRAVAVLYADRGNDGDLNVEALETLVRVAGLTVELLAASQSAPAPQPKVDEATEHVEKAAPKETETSPETAYDVDETESVSEVETPAYEEVSADEEVPTYGEIAVNGAEPEYEASSVEVEEEPVAEAVEPQEDVAEYTGEVTYEVEYTSSESDDVPVVAAPEVETFQPVAEVEEIAETVAVVEEEIEAIEEEPAPSFEFSSNSEYDASAASPAEPAFEQTSVPMVEAPVATNLNGDVDVATVVESVVEVASAQPKKSRFSDRNVDLPIEVAEDERRLHNDARRFARLLVSEIKLYNEQQVTEGREAGDLYDRLKEAIDRSREMYDKRVQPAVASKYDYFHYEILNNLAEGQDAKLGGNYPGATV